MLSFETIRSAYPPKEAAFGQFVLKEYLQYVILDIIFSSKHAQHLAFLGGTAIRIVHHSSRFSEDLDFDNFGLSEGDFEDLSRTVASELKKLGFECEIKNVFKGAYRCYVRIPKILKTLGFSEMEDEKILIQIDTVKQDYRYVSQKTLLDRFDVYKMIAVCPANIILSKKIHALFDRKRTKGRDFFDIAFLYRTVRPDFEYLAAKMEIRDNAELKRRLRDFCQDLDLEALAEDVGPFLINPEEKMRVVNFREFVETLPEGVE